ncbi:MAG: hypothetical protein LBC03_07225, partial [Nitrososphaerota archaeon]|nr:hypothetical protein [Nitrososphaerota archaeon]
MSLSVFLTVMSHRLVVEKNSPQDKAMDFMENVLSIEVSNYSVDLRIDSIYEGSRRVDVNMKANNLQYELSSENSNLRINFNIENDILTTYFMGTIGERVITTNKVTDQHDATYVFNF